MIALIGCILFSSFIFVLFKLFPKFGIDTFQAIVFNYVTAFLCGIILYGNTWKEEAWTDTNWLIAALICGVLFISLFVLMGKSSQVNGVARTSVSVKMSMAVSAICIGISVSESFSLWKILGILAAIVGVVLVSLDREKDSENKSIWLLFILFFGSGLLDFVLNFVQNHLLTHVSAALFSAIGFGIAGFIGVFVMAISIVRKESKIALKNILAGVCLGIPNFFSIYLLIEAYSSTGWSDSTVLAIVNISIVVISAILGFLAFKEKLTSQKLLGLLSALIAIGLLYYAN
jgi:drug/metabolite transporter (DMT)-like permease